MTRYMVFDLETSIHEAHKRKANAFYDKNYVVARGWKCRGDPKNSYEYYPKHDRTTYLRIPSDVNLLIGLNIKFDLLWEMAQGNPDLLPFFKRGGKIWDCQYAEYLIEGHIKEVQMVSMDGIVEKYGGRKKIDEVKMFWQQGVSTEF